MKVGDLLGGRYRIEALLGAGGMGSVWLARHLVTDKQVAIKTIHSDSKALRERFLREARAACAVNHENVVAVHDVFEGDDGAPVMVMDYLRGESLRDRLSRCGKLSEPEALAILAPVVSALGAAHGKGIVHRDLKPENVLLTSAGVVKVVDFGVAKILHDTRAPPMTETGAVLGTLLYMAPEQAFGENVDHRADTWAIGVVLFEALAGRRPIEGPTTGVIVRKLAQLDVPSLSSVAPEVSPALAALADRMLSGPPEDRPDLTEVARVFGELGHVVRGAAEAPTETAPAFDRVKASGSDVALLSTAMASAQRANPSTLDPPEERPARRHARVIAAAVIVVACAAAAGAWWSSTAPTAPATPQQASASASGPPAASAIAPPSCNPEARVAYSEGLNSLRRAEWPRADAAFTRALELDPQCAAAAVKKLLMMRNSSNDQRVEYFRGLYRLADSHRTSLSDRDVALLDALQPWVMREPGDFEEMRRRFRTAAEAFPRDVEAQFFAAILEEANPAVALVGLDRVLALDPDYLDAMQGRARCLDELGRREEALDQLETCLRKSPGSQCACDRAIALSNGGRCAEGELAARDYVAASAGSVEAYEILADALAGHDAPANAVEEAIRQVGRLSEPDVRTYVEPSLLTRYDLARGRFASAERRARKLLEAIDGRPDEKPHDEAARLLGQILGETGTAKDVKALAEPFFERRSVWSKGTESARGALALVVALDETGAVGHDEGLRRAKTWRDEGLKSARRPPVVAAQATLVVRTLEEATAWGELEPTPTPTMRHSAMRLVAGQGRFNLVSGRTDRAASALATTAKSCTVLQDPWLWVRAHLWLGQALEVKRDTAGACRSYGVVLERWGVEQPLGRTAREAKKRRGALHCDDAKKGSKP